MNLLISNEIEKTLGMQRDLALDGENPPGLKDYEYIKEMFINAEEMSENLASVLAQEVMNYTHTYAEENDYNVVLTASVGILTQLTVLDLEGDMLVQVAYNKMNEESRHLVLMGLADKYSKLMFL